MHVMIISLPKKAPEYSLADPTFLLKHMKEKKDVFLPDF